MYAAASYLTHTASGPISDPRDPPRGETVGGYNTFAPAFPMSSV
jgi:hypothetical protein